jgi:hypothetical protein
MQQQLSSQNEMMPSYEMGGSGTPMVLSLTGSPRQGEQSQNQHRKKKSQQPKLESTKQKQQQ